MQSTRQQSSHRHVTPPVCVCVCVYVRVCVCVTGSLHLFTDARAVPYQSQPNRSRLNIQNHTQIARQGCQHYRGVPLCCVCVCATVVYVCVPLTRVSRQQSVRARGNRGDQRYRAGCYAAYLRKASKGYEYAYMDRVRKTGERTQADAAYLRKASKGSKRG